MVKSSLLKYKISREDSPGWCQGLNCGHESGSLKWTGGKNIGDQTTMSHECSSPQDDVGGEKYHGQDVKDLDEWGKGR